MFALAHSLGLHLLTVYLLLFPPPFVLPWQYTMLIGQAPFHSRVKPNASNASVIMEKIIEGKISFDQPEWASVSPSAQDCVKGMYALPLTSEALSPTV